MAEQTNQAAPTPAPSVAELTELARQANESAAQAVRDLRELSRLLGVTPIEDEQP